MNNKTTIKSIDQYVFCEMCFKEDIHFEYGVQQF